MLIIPPHIIMILDGFGHGPENENNAISEAKTPNIDSLLQNYPNGLLKASGLDVGLPDGVMGNSEVGHTNIGAGRVRIFSFESKSRSNRHK